jgi:hypothetical protein
MPRWLTMNLDEDQATGLRALLCDCELPIDDQLRETLLRRLTAAMHEALMALAPEGPSIGDARRATWDGEASDRPARPARPAAHPPAGSRRSLRRRVGRF